MCADVTGVETSAASLQSAPRHTAEIFLNATFVSHPYSRGDTWIPKRRALASVQMAVDANADLLEALTWALAELRGQTKYDNPQQAIECFARADAAISKASGGAA